jgi:hypothetical protein
MLYEGNIDEHESIGRGILQSELIFDGEGSQDISRFEDHTQNNQ